MKVFQFGVHERVGTLLKVYFHANGSANLLQISQALLEELPKMRDLRVGWLLKKAS
ncbi:MAG: hypothetical protein ACRCTP_12210 [Aeromonas popoffii]|uniref:hypothetical protein n=1 Tax=Aeromonas popoffii TaxID=70856 RepID=UPI003F39696D